METVVIKQPFQQSLEPLQQWSSLLKREEHAGHDAHAKELQPLLPQQLEWLQKAPNVSLWQPAIVISTPSENTARSYVVSIPDGAKYQQNRLMLQQKVIPHEKLPVPPKPTSVIMNALLIRSELHPNESDSPPVKNPMNTNNNKGGSTGCPPKSTINLVPKKDIFEGDATIS